MAIDPDDLLEPPYGFGECSISGAYPAVSCKCFKENTNTHIVVRKHGSWVNVNISNIFAEVRNDIGVDFATIKIEPFLSSEFLGSNARKRLFGGLARVFELETEVLRVVPAMITMDKDGTITINPSIKVINEDDKIFQTVASSNFFFSTQTTKGAIGTLNINFSYVVDDGHTYDDDIKMTKLNNPSE